MATILSTMAGRLVATTTDTEGSDSTGSPAARRT